MNYIVFVDDISQVYAFVTKIIGGKLDEKLIWWHRWLVNNCQPERYTSKKQKSSTWFTCNRYNIFKRLSTQLSLLSSTTRRVKLYTSIANRIKFQKFFCLLGGEELSTKKKRKQKKKNFERCERPKKRKKAMPDFRETLLPSSVNNGLYTV